MCARRGGFDWGAGWAAWCDPGGGYGPGPWPGQKRRKRRGRFFDRGDLKYVVLRLLARKPMHGYEVMQALEAESRGWYSASAGSVYPVLQMLQDQGYVTSVEQDGRRVYTITDEGREYLARHTDRVEDVMGRVAGFAGRFSGGEMEDLARSFMRLARLSFEQAVRAVDDPAAADRIRDIIERAIREMQEEPGSDHGHAEGGANA